MRYLLRQIFSRSSEESDAPSRRAGAATVFSDENERARLSGFMSSLTRDRIVSDTGAYLDYLLTRPEVVGTTAELRFRPRDDDEVVTIAEILGAKLGTTLVFIVIVLLWFYALAIIILGGAVIGAMIMGVMNNGMSILGIGIDYQQVIKGLVLLAAVGFDVYNRRKGGR